MTKTLKIETATAAQYLNTLGLFHARDASLTVEGKLVHITARHMCDNSTRAMFDGAAPDALLVTVRTITNGKLGKGRALADDQRKVMLDADTVLTLVPTA
jgi:hypothetical protein